MYVIHARGARTRGPISVLVSLILAIAATALVSLGAPSAQAAIAVVLSSNSTESGSSLLLDKPTGTSQGQVMLAQITILTPSGTTITPPTGWTLHVRTDRSNQVGQAVYWKVAGPSEPLTYTWTFSASLASAGGITTYSGVDTVEPIEASSAIDGNSSTPSAPGVTATAGSRVVALFGLRGINDVSTPATMAERYLSASTNGVRAKAADKTQASTGSTGAFSAVLSPVNNQHWVGHLISLREPTNVAPTVGSITGASVVGEGSSSAYTVSATDPDSDTLTYAWSVQSGNGSISGAANLASATVDFGDGPSTVALRVIVNDGNGHPVQRDLDVTVNNLAPSATFNASSPVVEGSPIALSLTGATDPSAADTSADFTYAFDCGSGFGSFGAASTASCPTTDNGSRTVAGRVRDKDGGVTTYTATVAITNAAPTATFGNNGPVAEGSSFSLSLTDTADVSSADTAAGFTYMFDCGDGYGAPQAASSTSCATTDNGTRSVKGRVIDKDGGFTEYSGTVGVNNVNPTATFSATSPVNEGDDIDLSLTDPFDPSSADTTAGFGHAFDCDTSDGNPFIDNAGDSTESCSTADSGSRGVAGRISDKDGGSTSYSTDVTIDNVAPTGTFTPVSSVDEGSSFGLALSDVTDPSSVDAALLEFAFDCGDGSGFGAFGASSATCPTDDDGSRTVGVTVRDKDGGTNTYTATVTVNSVAPTANLEINPAGDVDEGSDFTLSLVDAFDPSSVDLPGLTYAFDCGDAAGLQPASTQNSATCPTDDNGTRDVVAWVIDPDGDRTSYQATVTVINVSPEPTLSAPASVNEGSDIHLEVSDVQDVSSADEAAGFTFAFDCGSGFGLYGASDSIDCPTTDNEFRSVAVRAQDKDGGVGQASALVEVVNIAPEATFETADVNEGDPISLALTNVTDASPVDTFTFAFHCGSAPFGGFTAGDFGASSTATCPTNDSGDRTVTGAVRDDDGGTTAYSVDVTVNNVAPTGTFNTGDVDEGSPISLSISGVTDPSSVDTAAGFEYAFDCGSGYGVWGTSDSANCPTTDQGSRTVKGKVRDKDGGESEATATVRINSVAPTGTFTAPSSVLEGDDIDLAISDVTDPSPDDTAAGFTFAFDCGDGYGVFSSTASRICATNDNGDRTVGGKVQDKDEHASEYGATVQVDNVAPSGTFNNPASVAEGSDFTLSLSGVTDPSSADTAAGFEYAFDCGSGYGAFGSDSSRTCPTTDNGNRAVGGKVRDKDGGVREYTATTTVLNVAPTVVAPAGQSTLPGVSTSFTLGSFSDPGVNDNPWTIDVSWGDGDTDTYTTNSQGAIANRSHTYALAGPYTVTVRVTDKDGDYSQASFTVEVNLTDKVLLGNEDVEIAGAQSQILGNVHANRDVKISGAGGDICGDLTAGRTVVKIGTQSCGTTTAPAPLVVLPNMANYVPTTATHTLTGDQVLNGYTCTLAGGCVVRVTGKLDIRGLITGKVWFLVDKDVTIKGDLAPANATSKLRIYSKLTIDASGAKASITGQFLAETGLKLSGSTQMLTGLFWGKQYVDMSGSNGSLRGAVISNGSIRLAGSSRTITYDAAAIKF
jgi:hypothetical protein